MAKRHPGDPIPPRSSHNPDRRSLHLNLTAAEYATIAERAAIAGLSRPRYIREAALAVQIYRTTAPADLLARTTRAIACVTALARSIAVSQSHHTRRHLESAMMELYEKDAELERHGEYIAAALALRPPGSPEGMAPDQRRLPGPGAAIWREPSTDARRL
jgi:hypothetical protein